MSREAMQQALEALELYQSRMSVQMFDEAVRALRQALQTDQEPVAWANSFDLQNFDMKVRTCPDLHHTVPLYTAPPKREWVGLTDEDKHYLNEVLNLQGRFPIIDAIEAKLKEKNT